MAIRTILCPVDFSDCSDQAIRYALSLAEQVGAEEVRLLHAHPPIAMSFPPAAKVRADRDAGAQQFLARELEAFARRYSGHGIAVVPEVVTGVAHLAILDAARSGVDLIVMGTHGRGGASHFLLGSVAEAVVAASRVPVCTVGMTRKSRARPRRRRARQGAAS